MLWCFDMENQNNNKYANIFAYILVVWKENVEECKYSTRDFKYSRYYLEFWLWEYILFNCSYLMIPSVHSFYLRKTLASRFISTCKWQAFIVR